jgi:hypothetical protein
MVYRIVLFLAMVGVGWGQRSDTIYQTLVNNQVTPGVFSSLPINNIGQAGHALQVILSGTCNAPTISGGLNYSFDNVNYYGFGYQAPVTSSYYLTIQATGAYPFVIPNLTFTPTTCTIKVYYTGVLSVPSPYIQGYLKAGTPVSVYTDNDQPYPVVSGFMFATDTSGVQGVVANTIEGGTTANVNVAVGTTGRLNTTVTNVAARVYISHLDLTSDTNATVITLIEGTGVACATAPSTIGTWILNTGMPLMIGKLRAQQLGDNVCITTAVGTVKGSITYGQMGSSSAGN